MLTIKAGANSTEGSSASFVDGPMRKAGTTAFVFPVGDGSRYARIAIGVPTSSTTFEAEYINNIYSNTSSMATTPTPVLNNVSENEYWNLTQAVGSGNTILGKCL